MSIKTLYKPHVFQGRLDKRPYFEGWYFKITDPKQDLSLCLIPGISNGRAESAHGFIQYADSLTGKSGKINFPLDQVSLSKDTLALQFGEHHFSESALSIKACEGLPLQIDLRVSEPRLYPVNWHHPGIMGPFRFMPAMECYHGVYLVNSRIDGTLQLGETTYTIDDGSLYVEKDWGKSFPSSWIWLQANAFKSVDFDQREVSLMLSVAKIPWMGRHFIGHLGFIWLDERRIGLGTYYGSQVSVNFDDPQGQEVELVVNHGNYHIVITAQARKPVSLIAPSFGEMVRYIDEDLDALITLEVYFEGQMIYSGESGFGGYERCGVLSDLEAI